MQKLKTLAIIPDGNRRFAFKNNINVRKAYTKGFEKVKEVLKWIKNTEIERICFWALSLENFEKRSSAELKILFRLMKMNIDEALKDKSFENENVKIKFFGKLSLLPKDLREKMLELEKNTSAGEKSLDIAIAYSGKEEILQAAKLIAINFSGKISEVESITEKDFEKYLYIQATPDLVIRTGSVSRLSGFLPWQNAYSEIHFSNRLWPEFELADFKKALRLFYESERRFGR